MSWSVRCHLCSQIAGHPGNDLLSSVLGDDSYVRRVALETENFALVPSVGPIADGHVLLCPKRHLCSFSGIPILMDAEFGQIKAMTIALLTSKFAKPIHCFEHGMRRDGSRVLCTVEHAHLHFVPAPVDVRDVLGCEADPWVPIESTLLSLAAETGGDEYLMYETPSRQSYVMRADNREIESQYIRKVFAAKMGEAETWNWRDYPKIEQLRETWNVIS